MLNRTQLYIALTAFFMIISLPAFLFGFKLAMIFNSLIIIPVPAMITVILACYFMYKAEESVC